MARYEVPIKNLIVDMCIECILILIRAKIEFETNISLKSYHLKNPKKVVLMWMHYGLLL